MCEISISIEILFFILTKDGIIAIVYCDDLYFKKGLLLCYYQTKLPHHLKDLSDIQEHC